MSCPASTHTLIVKLVGRVQSVYCSALLWLHQTTTINNQARPLRSWESESVIGIFYKNIGSQIIESVIIYKGQQQSSFICILYCYLSSLHSHKGWQFLDISPPWSGLLAPGDLRSGDNFWSVTKYCWGEAGLATLMTSKQEIPLSLLAAVWIFRV